MMSRVFTFSRFLCASITLLICGSNIFAQGVFMGDSVALGDGMV